MATQNPVEQEGTYPLPEAQLDRFMFKMSVGYPDRADEDEILDAINAAIGTLPVLIEHGSELAKTRLHSRGMNPCAYKKDSSNNPTED